MIAMLDTSHDLGEAEAELAYPVEQLLTPLTRFRPQRPDQRFAIDNGAFAGFNAKAFKALLEREKPRLGLCRFVSVPDVVCSARRTLELFDYWAPQLPGWPLALVAQNGQEDLPIPWKRISAIFLGGDDEWKDGKHAAAIVYTAKAMGVWVHAGRVNGLTRWTRFAQLGVDSVDGTGIARFTEMREKIQRARMQRSLFDLARGDEPCACELDAGAEGAGR